MTKPGAKRVHKRADGASHTYNGYDLDAEAVEFGRAVQAWKEKHRRVFPSNSELLQIAMSLGYRKVAPPERS